MNTRIARRLFETESKYPTQLDATARDIVEAHNQASYNGFIELPLLNYRTANSNANGSITIAVSPKCGTTSLNDLYNIKSAWGADSLDVCDENGLAILLNFSR